MMKSSCSRMRMFLSLLMVLCCYIPGGVGECGDGEVKDLDGRCVKKVTFPPRERKPCPHLEIDHGVFFPTNERMAHFYCDTGYVRVPDTEVAICQVTGSWSKQVPVCLMAGCEIPSPPQHGSMLTRFETTLLEFSCNSGHRIKGDEVLACLDGTNWNGSVPRCPRIKVPTTPAPSAKWDGTTGGADARHVTVSGLAVLSLLLFTLR